MKIEGKNNVRECLSSGKTVEKIMVQKGNFDRTTNDLIRLAKEKGVRVQFCDKAGLDRLSETGSHQGIIAIATEFVYAEFDDIIKDSEGESGGLILVLDGIEDPMNLGAIIRSAECLGANGIVIGKHHAVSVNELVMKASAGATSHIKIARVTNVNDALRTLKEHFFTVYAADMDGKPLNQTKFAKNAVFVIGGEGDGVKRLTKSLCDETVAIKMSGKINSLNASVAAGIMLYAFNTAKK